ncbi:MAG TPA: aminotransferase class IV [Acidimicrobiales bacterium]|nr:aminotransferase class IV [Acidimicrobiales bacterium]
MYRVFVDGALVAPESASVSVFDHGLVVGDGVFETLLVRGQVPFALERHLGRLQASAAGLELELPSLDLIRGAVAEVLAQAPEDRSIQSRLRITVTGGEAPLGSGRGDGPSTLVVAMGSLPPATDVASVCVVPWPRNEHGALVGLKTTSYAENVVALRHAAERSAGEAIFGNTAGNLCEGTGSNVFVVKGGVLTTPPLSAGPLAGVTRGLVMEVVPTEEADFELADFAEGRFDEAFLTSTTRAVQPIAVVDGRPVECVPGPVTKAAMEALAGLMANTDEP